MGVKDSAAVLTEDAVFNAIVMEYVLEGNSLMAAIRMAEDTITPQNIKDLERMPGYDKLRKDIQYFFKACDGVEGYRDSDFRKGPTKALKAEADFCQDTADYLGSLRFKGFKPEQTQELMKDTAKDVEYLDRSALRLRNMLKKQDDSIYLKPDGSVNVNTRQKPAEYARRALRMIRDLFKRLGVKWDYDPDFNYNKVPKVDYRKYVADYESKILESKGFGRNEIEIELIYDEKEAQEDPTKIDKLYDAVCKIAEHVDVDRETCVISVEWDEDFSWYYTPAVYYTRNGDGSPEEYEDDATHEEDLKDALRPLQRILSFDIETCYCSVDHEDPMEGYADYYESKNIHLKENSGTATNEIEVEIFYDKEEALKNPEKVSKLARSITAVIPGVRNCEIDEDDFYIYVHAEETFSWSREYDGESEEYIDTAMHEKELLASLDRLKSILDFDVYTCNCTVDDES